MNQSGRDISSLYMDDGYLFFSVTPVETAVEGDSIDMEMRLYEGKQARINKVTVDGTEVVIQEQVVEAKPFCRLLRFKRFTDNGALLDKMRAQPSVLVVAPLSGHHATLLRDTVRTLLQDHKVYITDWIDARMVPPEDGLFHLDDYINYVQDFIRKVGPDVHVISVCQPTVPVLAAVSLMASRGETTPLSMVMMGGPIDARKSPTAVNNLAMNKSHSWFENNVIYRVPPNFPGAGRRVYPGFMQHTGFVAMNPDRHLTSHYDYFLDLVRGGYGYAALTDSAMRSHLTDAELVGIPIESPHVVSTLCLAQSAKKKATPLIRKTSLALRELSRLVCAPL